MSATHQMPVQVSHPINWHHPLNQGRLAWWLALPGLEGGAKFYDLCGKTHGTLTSFGTGSGWRGTTQPGSIGAGLLFDGADDYVAVSPAWGTLSRWSAAAWVRDIGVGSSSGPVIIKAGTSAFQFVTSGGTAYVRYYNGGSAFDAATTRAGWHRLIATYDSATIRLYCDGQRILATSSGSCSLPAPERIGSYTGSTSNQWEGNLNDVSVWGRMLSDVEVRDDYDLSRQGYPDVLNRLSMPMDTPSATTDTILLLRRPSGLLTRGL